MAITYARSLCVEAREPAAGGERGIQTQATHVIKFSGSDTTVHVDSATDRITQFRLRPAASILMAADWPLEMTC